MRWVALLFLFAGETVPTALGAKPSGGPTNPHGTGREATPIEREFHVAPAAEPRWTVGVPELQKPRINGEIWMAVKLVLPWMIVPLDQ